MRGRKRFILGAAFLLMMMLAAAPGAWADVNVQCPGDTNGDGVIDSPDPEYPNARCMSVTAGDGFAKMGDGVAMYTFGFHDVTGTAPENVMDAGSLAHEWPGPTIVLNEGDQFFLSLSPVGMVLRPDLFDPHSIHFHGFPNASTIFDGEPMASTSTNMGSSFTFYYNIVEPGTYLWHCHVEATEHMQMGMLANLYVRPAQNGSAVGGCASQQYVYNDGDGSTCYDVEFPLQMSGFDPRFHTEHINVQPLPFAYMLDTYPMMNGRGYPDTVDPNPLTPVDENPAGKVSQVVSSRVAATQGQKILLRLSSVGTVDHYTIRVLGIPMRVVGKDARLLRGPTGIDLSYETTAVTMGGGMTFDAILDTQNVPPGTYFLYTTNLHNLSNDTEDFGGMMTEIIIN